MSKFHINTMGKALKCSASKDGCPFGTSDDHYETEKQAYEAYEAHMSEEFTKALNGSKRVKESQRSIVYEVQHENSKEQETLIRNCIIEKRTMSQFERATHNLYVADIITQLEEDGLTTDRTHADKIPGGLVFNPERARAHNEIVQEIMNEAENVPTNGEAIFAGGLGGAGKSTVLKEYSNVDKSQYVTLNPDDIKEIMAEKGLIPKVEGLTPMEASPLVHEEASHITAILLERLRQKKKNIIFDITMASHESVKKRIDLLNEKGYSKVEAIFVDIKPETSKERGDFRYNMGLDSYLTSGEGNGGRPLPARLTKGQAASDSRYNSKNAEVLVQLQKSNLFTSTPRVFDNDVYGRAPIEVSFKSFCK